jgi:hypothetical protein
MLDVNNKSTIQKRTRLKKDNEFYVDNQEFYARMVEYTDKFKLYTKGDLEKPPKISNYIGSVITLIATRLAMSHSFTNYSYKDEMIGDAITNCILYLDKFTPIRKIKIHELKNKTPDEYKLLDIIDTLVVEDVLKEIKKIERFKSLKVLGYIPKDNIVEVAGHPFAYFTMVCRNAFIRKIHDEHREQYVKAKMFENVNTTNELIGMSQDDYTHLSNAYEEIGIDRLGDVIVKFEQRLKDNKTAKKLKEEEENDN